MCDDNDYREIKLWNKSEKNMELGPLMHNHPSLDLY